MISRSRRGLRDKDAQEMNITAFMNLMVVLVPFLLITAVFSRLTILELNLPAGASAADPQAPLLELEIVVHQDRIDVADRNSGLLGSYPTASGKHDLVAVQEKLKAVKAEYPELINATILLEPDTAYDTVVQVMDSVRTYSVQQDGRRIRAELFPEISIGDAPT